MCMIFCCIYIYISIRCGLSLLCKCDSVCPFIVYKCDSVLPFIVYESNPVAWISMDIHGYPWISMDIHGYPWISLDIHGYPSMDINGYPWISMDIYGYPWMSMDVHGYCRRRRLPFKSPHQPVGGEIARAGWLAVWKATPTPSFLRLPLRSKDLTITHA